MSERGWIGVDFDGTLATESIETWPTPGPPVPKMLERVKGWLAEGRDVRIFTARVGYSQDAHASVEAAVAFVEEQRRIVEDYCRTHLGRILPVTCEKDFQMLELWDDRAIQVMPNTGETLLKWLEGRMFPIQDGPDIPWSVIEPFAKQAKKQHDQTLERLAQRGGLSVCEALAVLEGNGDFYGYWKGREHELAQHADKTPHILKLESLVRERLAAHAG